jgi:hypothetical protein
MAHVLLACLLIVVYCAIICVLMWFLVTKRR